MQSSWIGGSWLAQVEQVQPNAQGEPAPFNPFSFAIPMLAIFALFYFIMLRPQRRDEQRRRELLAALKKNDHVVTIGGIYGVVTNVKTTEDEVTLRVDDVTNTKLRVTRGSIARVIVPGSEETEKPKDA